MLTWLLSRNQRNRYMRYCRCYTHSYCTGGNRRGNVRRCAHLASTLRESSQDNEVDRLCSRARHSQRRSVLTFLRKLSPAGPFCLSIAQRLASRYPHTAERPRLPSLPQPPAVISHDHIRADRFSVHDRPRKCWPMVANVVSSAVTPGLCATHFERTGTAICFVHRL